jgi:prevent-host-death family protein
MSKEETMKEKAINIAEAKKHFSELLGQVAYGMKHIVITKRGRPMARLIPARENDRHLCNAVGWLENDDPFFEAIDCIEVSRGNQVSSEFKQGPED